MIALGVPGPLVEHMHEDKPKWHPMHRQTMLYIQWHFATHVRHISLRQYLNETDELEQQIDYWGGVMTTAYTNYWNMLEKDRTWWPYKPPEKRVYDAYGRMPR